MTSEIQQETTRLDGQPLWALPKAEGMEQDQLQARIDIYGESVLLRLYQTGVTTVRMVSPEAMARAMTRHLETSSGLMPPSTLWWKQNPGGGSTALWRDARVWPVALHKKMLQKPERLRLPMPPLLFICRPATAPWVFAAKERPQRPEDQLYHAPTFNVFHNGQVCQGSHTFPPEVSEIPEAFFESYFSMTGDHQQRLNSGRTITDLWAEIDGADHFPMEELVPVITVAEAMKLS